jgi:hypothetical protein
LRSIEEVPVVSTVTSGIVESQFEFSNSLLRTPVSRRALATFGRVLADKSLRLNLRLVASRQRRVGATANREYASAR